MADPFRVLVPVDGSPESESILATIRPLALSRPTEITLLRVVEGADEADAARATLHRLAGGLLMDGLSAVSRLEWGSPADTIEYLARPVRHDLLAMTTHGRSGLRRALLGGTAQALLARARIPLILDRPGGSAGNWRRIALAVDGATPADEIVRFIAPLALALRAEVSVVHVLEPLRLLAERRPDARPALERAVEDLAARGVPAESVLITDRPAAGIARFLDESGCGLLAMTTSGRHGSVTEEVLRQARVPILVRRLEESRVAAIA